VRPELRDPAATCVGQQPVFPHHLFYYLLVATSGGHT
jgi:hypothetical protein